METTKIVPCKCASEFQDNEYGKGLRLHNISQKGKNIKLGICTVCGDSRRRNKSEKDVFAKDNKAFGMTHDHIGLKNRNYK